MQANLSLLIQKKNEIQGLLTALEQFKTLDEKLDFLNSLPHVQDFLARSSCLRSFLKDLPYPSEFAVKSVIALGQGSIVFNIPEHLDHPAKQLNSLLSHLIELENFYFSQGGIIGYHLTVLSLIIAQCYPSEEIFEKMRYIHPEGIYLGEETLEVRRAVRWGIDNISNLAEMCPLGGAGDRLNLIDSDSKQSLPAALLPFLGRSLLEGLMRDLQAREYLAFKCSGKQNQTPVALMTSVEKDNHLHILKICEACEWFGRGPDSFYFLIQPLVPVLTSEGNWALNAPLELALKPSGHGVLWKLAEEQGAFAWLESLERRYCLVRQINNPLGGIDNAILALVGIGCHERKAFGFLSCERLLNSAEGTNVLIESCGVDHYDYCLTNIEYTDFIQKGVGELPASIGSPYSIYPANTNILFADISAIRSAMRSLPIPGQLINMKSKVSYIDSTGKQSFMCGGRLESTMQNIADAFIDTFPRELSKAECKSALRTFIVYNPRSKTISTTKQSYVSGESPLSTPEQALYDLLSNNHALFRQCGLDLPLWTDFENYLAKGPACLILFHPALGPLYSVITQKIRQGSLQAGSELQLEAAEVDIEALHLQGSLLVHALSPLGLHSKEGLLSYGQESRCTMRHVTIKNKGIDYQNSAPFWRNAFTRFEAAEILLHEGAEFDAEGVILEGNQRFEVPAFHRLVIRSSAGGQWTEQLYPINTPTWLWKYSFDEEDRLQLKKLVGDNSC